MSIVKDINKSEGYLSIEEYKRRLYDTIEAFDLIHEYPYILDDRYLEINKLFISGALFDKNAETEQVILALDLARELKDFNENYLDIILDRLIVDFKEEKEEKEDNGDLWLSYYDYAFDYHLSKKPSSLKKEDLITVVITKEPKEQPKKNDNEDPILNLQRHFFLAVSSEEVSISAVSQIYITVLEATIPTVWYRFFAKLEEVLVHLGQKKDYHKFFEFYDKLLLLILKEKPFNAKVKRELIVKYHEIFDQYKQLSA